MTTLTYDALRDAFPETAKDLKLNLESVLGEGALTEAQRLGVALACAAALRCAPLREALLERTRAQAGEAVAQDALAVAALMGMNNVYYRFRHLVGKESYSQIPPRLRMNRLNRPAGSKVDCELFSLAVSAVNACETCIQAHERELRNAGVTEAMIHDAVRIAAVISGSATALS
jgi:alkyl hydroperoxide reductase subunit D